MVMVRGDLVEGWKKSWIIHHTYLKLLADTSLVCQVEVTKHLKRYYKIVSIDKYATYVHWLGSLGHQTYLRLAHESVVDC